MVSTAPVGVPNNALALDSAATISIIENKTFLDQVWTLIKKVTIHCGGISTQCTSA